MGPSRRARSPKPDVPAQASALISGDRHPRSILSVPVRSAPMRGHMPFKCASRDFVPCRAEKNLAVPVCRTQSLRALERYQPFGVFQFLAPTPGSRQRAMRHDWIFDVLTDLRSYAVQNGLRDLADQVEITLHAARRDVAAADQPKGGADVLLQDDTPTPRRRH